MPDNNNVFGKLDVIEDKIESQNKKMSISDYIGEDFHEYMKKSTLYLYEKDERSFLRQRRSAINKSIIFLLISFIPLICDIVFYVLYSKPMTIKYIADVLIISSTILYLLYLVFQKRKKLAKSIWNINNYEFYEVDNRLKLERSKGMIGYVLRIYSSFASVALIVVTFILLISDTNFYGDGLPMIITFVLNVGVGVLRFPTSFFQIGLPYCSFIFDTETSYVIYDTSNDEWKKINK